MYLDIKNDILFNIYSNMFFHLLSTICRNCCINYFEDAKAVHKYLGWDVIDKYNEYIRKEGYSFVTYVPEEILGIAITIYERKYGETIIPKFEFDNDEARKFLDSNYIDVEFLDDIDKRYWHVCEHLVVFLKKEICSDSDFLQYMGKCYMELILNGQYQNTIADKYLYAALGVLQAKNRSINWKVDYRDYLDKAILNWM